MQNSDKNGIKVYTTPICAYCHTLKEFLKERNVIFEEIDVSEDEKTRDYLIQKTGRMEVPMLEINGEIVVGFDRGKITRLLKIKD